MSKTAVLEKWYEQVWVKGDLDAISTFLEPETQAAGIIPEMRVGPGDFRDLVAAFRSHVVDISVNIVKSLESDAWLAALFHVHASRADNGSPIEVTGQVMARFSSDKMVETYNHFDFISLFEQLGQFPKDTLPVCMTGQKMIWA